MNAQDLVLLGTILKWFNLFILIEWWFKLIDANGAKAAANTETTDPATLINLEMENLSLAQ
jgi:NhaP-type Na+/H+ or K+/H+ antiporter